MTTEEKLATAVELLETVVNSYEDAGCEDCGTISAEIYKNAIDFLLDLRIEKRLVDTEK